MNMNILSPFSRLLSFLLLGLFFSLSACGGRDTGSLAPYTGPPALDVLIYPQDLFAYVDAAGGIQLLVSPAEQEAAAERQKEAWYRPWRLTRSARWIEESLEKNFNMRLAGAYTNDHRPFPEDVWADTCLTAVL